MPLNRSRILIADDHNLMAELCKKLLEPEFDVVGTVSNGRAMLQAAAELRPDVIVVDVAMPILNGLEAAHRVKEILPLVKLVFLTMHKDPKLAAEALRRGASGYLLKTCASFEMVTAIRKVLRGESYLSSTLDTERVKYCQWRYRKLAEEKERLTERQREVLQLLAEGRVMKEVGTILKMTPRTVAFHKYRIMETLGARSSADLVRYAVRNRMVAG